MSDASGEPPGPSPAESLPPQSRRDAARVRRDQQQPPPQQDPSAAFPQQFRAARDGLENQVAHARAEFEEANERIKQRTGRDLILATLIGLAMGAVLIASLIFVKWLFLIFALAATILGLFEFGRALNAAGRRMDVWPQIGAGVVLVLAGYFLDPWLHWVTTFVAVAFVIVWRLLAQMVAHDGRTYGAVLSDVLVTGFAQLYVAFLASLCVVLLHQEGGEWWVLAFIIIAVASDTGAYGTGLAFGRHPMAPRISPKKTWDGFAGAALAALLAGLLTGMFMLHIPWWAGLVLGAVILLTATAGDLGESMIKRDLGIKDMSNLLPGHGGLLDRIDSLLVSIPVAWMLFTLFLN